MVQMMNQPRALVPFHAEMRLGEMTLPFSSDLLDVVINNRISGDPIPTLQRILTMWSNPSMRASFIRHTRLQCGINSKAQTQDGLIPKIFVSGTSERLIKVGDKVGSADQELDLLNLKVLKLGTGDLAYLVFPAETDRNSTAPTLVTKDQIFTIQPSGAIIETLNPGNRSIKNHDGESELLEFISGTSRADQGKELYLRIKNPDGTQTNRTLDVCMVDVTNPQKLTTESIQSFQLPETVDQEISHIEAQLPGFTHADVSKYIAFKATKIDGTKIYWLTDKSGRVIQQFSEAEYSSYDMVGTVKRNFKDVADMIKVDSAEKDTRGEAKNDLLIIYPSGEIIRIAGIDSLIPGRQIQEARGVALPTIWYWQGDNLGIFDLRTRKSHLIPYEEIKQAAQAENIEIGEEQDDFRRDKISKGVFSINGGFLLQLERGNEKSYIVSSLAENTPFIVVKDKPINTDIMSTHVSPNADALVLGTIGKPLSNGVSLIVSDSSSPILENIELPVMEWLNQTKIASMYGSEINRKMGELAKVEFDGDEITLTVLYTVPTNKRNENDGKMEETTPKFTFARRLVVSIKDKELKHEYLDVPFTSTNESAIAFKHNTIDFTTYTRNNIYLHNVDREFPYFINIRQSLSEAGFNPEACHIEVPALFQVDGKNVAKVVDESDPKKYGIIIGNKVIQISTRGADESIGMIGILQNGTIVVEVKSREETGQYNRLEFFDGTGVARGSSEGIISLIHDRESEELIALQQSGDKTSEIRFPLMKS